MILGSNQTYQKIPRNRVLRGIFLTVLSFLPFFGHAEIIHFGPLAGRQKLRKLVFSNFIASEKVTMADATRPN